MISMKISTNIIILLFMLWAQTDWNMIYGNSSSMAPSPIKCICFDNDTLNQQKKIRKFISKISNGHYSYYDLQKANPRSSYFSGTLIKELKGIQYARQIEIILNPQFNPYATITKNGYFFQLTKEDLLVIQGLYENWFSTYYATDNNRITETSALDDSIYKWECP